MWGGITDSLTWVILAGVRELAALLLARACGTGTTDSTQAKSSDACDARGVRCGVRGVSCAVNAGRGSGPFCRYR